MAGKLAKETYKKHENNAQCMRIWVAKFFFLILLSRDQCLG
jgi:hypothetical protein